MPWRCQCSHGAHARTRSQAAAACRGPPSSRFPRRLSTRDRRTHGHCTRGRRIRDCHARQATPEASGQLPLRHRATCSAAPRCRPRREMRCRSGLRPSPPPKLSRVASCMVDACRQPSRHTSTAQLRRPQHFRFWQRSHARCTLLPYNLGNLGMASMNSRVRFKSHGECEATCDLPHGARSNQPM